MKSADIIRHRLINQQIAATKFKKPQEIVAWLVAMQAQEFAMAKWAIGLRLTIVKEPDIEKAFNDGDILRTHLMRPTWHFITPADIRWMLALTAPRVNAANAFMYRKLELDDKIFKRSNDIISKTLKGGKHLTRTILKTALEKGKINANGLRLAYLMMRAELDGVICSGPRVGKQFTYALLDERVPPTKKLTREEALATLGLRYFSSRGPATVYDFAAWSGLTIKEVKEAVAMLPREFKHVAIEGNAYIFLPHKNIKDNLKLKLQATFLMPDYDEYVMSYKDRSAISGLPPGDTGTKNLSSITPYSHWLVMDGKIAGTWKIINKKRVSIDEISLFAVVNKTKQRAVLDAVKKYRTFLENDKD